MYSRGAADAYRIRHMLLTTREIDQMRRNLGMTWKQFAKYVNVGIATLKRWMRGEIQTAALDSLVRLKADPSYAQQALEELLGRLVADAAGTMQPVEPATHRRSARGPVRFELPEMVTDSNYALAA
jgi:transcriptional regulator with XRE-family HTH domain